MYHHTQICKDTVVLRIIFFNVLTDLLEYNLFINGLFNSKPQLIFKNIILPHLVKYIQESQHSCLCVNTIYQIIVKYKRQK